MFVVCLFVCLPLPTAPEAWLVDADVHFGGLGDLEGQQLVVAACVGVEHTLHPGGVPARPILAHVHLTEVPAEEQQRESQYFTVHNIILSNITFSYN